MKLGGKVFQVSWSYGDTLCSFGAFYLCSEGYEACTTGFLNVCIFPQSCNDLEIILEKKPYNVALESQVIHKSIPKYLLILEEMLQLEERCNICSFFINTLMKDL
jgi:hypothetical protein